MIQSAQGATKPIEAPFVAPLKQTSYIAHATSTVVAPAGRSTIVPVAPDVEDNEDDPTQDDAPRPAGSDALTREEYLAQHKRVRRKGEWGQEADEVQKAEALGYVMSSSSNRNPQHRINGLQRILQEREAGRKRQEFREEEQRRRDEAVVNALLRMVQGGAT